MAQLTIADLPDALLTEVLSLLEPADLRRAALVSRRWHECAHAPELCRSVEVGKVRTAQLRSLLPWLLRHGRHVRRLDLRLFVPVRAANRLLASCTAACAQLEDLNVETRMFDLNDPALAVGAWATALHRLQRLALNSGGVVVSASLHPLTALRKLRLGGLDDMRLSPGVQLPPGLEELELSGVHVRLPEQLAGLSALHTLVLWNSSQSADGYGALERLPRLRRLQCIDCKHVLPCLSRLTGLEELLVQGSGSDAASLDAALLALTGLTSLACLGMPATLQLPLSITGLSRLQRACFSYVIGGDPHGGYAALPAGPWAGSLRQLGASYDTLLLSGQLLAAASQLQQVAVLGGNLAAEPTAASEGFWRWCASHPPLRQLHIETVPYMPPELPFLAAVEGLRGARPALQVHPHEGYFSGSFFHSI